MSAKEIRIIKFMKETLNKLSEDSIDDLIFKLSYIGELKQCYNSALEELECKYDGRFLDYLISYDDELHISVITAIQERIVKLDLYTEKIKEKLKQLLLESEVTD